MSTKRELWTFESATNLWRLLGLLFLCLLWLQNPVSEGGVILLLFLIVMTLARWRFHLPGWTVLIDQTACLLTMMYLPIAVLGLAMPGFESFLKREPWFVLPTVIVTAFYPETSFLLVVFLIQAGVSGAILGGWAKGTKKNQIEADRQRRDRYELESLKEELLLANAQGAQMAELAERNRIAQQLHDDVGHELTASILALQAFEHLWKENDPTAVDMFNQAQKRLTNSGIHLRETVHNLKPVKELAIEGLHEIADQFTLCPVNFQVFGDTSKIPAHLWMILYPTLKEALTNTIRHAKPTKVEISLDISPHILRLSVYNDGVSKDRESQEAGIGLRNLRQRAKALGGSLAIDTSDGFLLICVLPIETTEQGRLTE